MNKSKVYIRVDGNKDIGLGHVYRCYALAQMLETEFQIAFWCREIPESLKSTIEEKFNVNLFKEQEAFFKELRTEKPIVVCDGYKFTEEYQKVIKKEGVSLVCIDDIHKTRFVADLVLNHSPAVTNENYRTSIGTKLLLGLDYVLLRRPFLEMAREIERSQQVKSAFICFGGIDMYNLTQKCTEAVLCCDHIEDINIVLGSKNPQKEKLTYFAKENDKSIDIFSDIDANKFSQLLRSSDLSIVPSSSVLFESLSAKNFILTGHYVENQKSISNYFSDNNDSCIKSVGDFRSLSIQELSKTLNSFIDLHNSNFTKCKTYIDGFSDKRVLGEFKKLKQ